MLVYDVSSCDRGILWGTVSSSDAHRNRTHSQQHQQCAGGLATWIVEVGEMQHYLKGELSCFYHTHKTPATVESDGSHRETNIGLEQTGPRVGCMARQSNSQYFVVFIRVDGDT
jgi:hypothetical protein